MHTHAHACTLTLNMAGRLLLGHVSACAHAWSTAYALDRFSFGLVRARFLAHCARPLAPFLTATLGEFASRFVAPALPARPRSNVDAVLPSHVTVFWKEVQIGVFREWKRLRFCPGHAGGLPYECLCPWTQVRTSPSCGRACVRASERAP